MFFRNCYLIFLLFCICGVLYAGGQSEAFREASMLINLPADTEEERRENNRKAADIIERNIADIRADQTDPAVGNSERQLVDLKFLLIDAYFNFRHYGDAIRVIADILENHSEHYDKAYVKFQLIRNERDHFSELLALFIAEIQKDPNDPVDPLDEEKALEYLLEAERSNSANDVDMANLLRENKRLIKLAIDRGYRDLILQTAHRRILEGNFIAAMNQYVDISNFETRGRYQRSFDLQWDEFLELELPDSFINDIESLHEQVEIFIGDFADVAARIEGEAPAAIAAVANFQTLREENPELGLFFTSMGDFFTVRSLIEASAVRIRNLRDQFTASFPDEEGNVNSEYLFYLEQFIAGPAQFENEGIVGAALRESSRIVDPFKEFLIAGVENYWNGSTTALQNKSVDELVEFQELLQNSSELALIFFSYNGQGTRISRESPPEFIASLRLDDQQDAVDMFFKGLLIDARIGLLQLFNTRSAESQTNELDEEILIALNTEINFLVDIEEYSIGIQEGMRAFADSLPISVSPVEDYINQYIADRNALNWKIFSRTTAYFYRYLEDDQERMRELDILVENAVNAGRRNLAGIEAILTVGDSIEESIRYYPEVARDHFADALNGIREIISLSENIIDIINIIDQNSTFLNEAPIRAVYDERKMIITERQQFLEEIQSDFDAASEQIEIADAFLADARSYRLDFTAAIDQQNYTAANAAFTALDNAYSQSLDVNYREDVRSERDDVLNVLSQSIVDSLIDTANRNKTIALEQVIIGISSQEYFAARDALSDAQYWDDQLPTPRDPTIIAFESEIERAILLSGQRDIPPIYDSRYSRITNDLNEASKALARAQSASENSDTLVLRQEIEKSRSFISSVRDEIPANFEVSFVELQLIQLESPSGFDDFFQEQIDNVETLVFGANQGDFGSGEYSEYTLFEKDQLLSRIAALNELRRNSRLEEIIIDIEVDLGRRESPEIVEAFRRANVLLNGGETLLASARRESNPVRYENLVNQALDNLRQAQAVFPKISRLPALISEAESLLGLEITVSLPFDANQLFEQAATLFANQNLVEAKRLLDILWANETYRSYFPLRQLISELYDLLGQSLSGV
ncbi:MAG: hypothetical protein ACR2PY_07150 [Salinispira sp.]